MRFPVKHSFRKTDRYLSSLSESTSLIVARELLGCYLGTYLQGVLAGGIIIETEAYGHRQVKDLAAHSACGTTDRNKSMFLEGGHLYVYKSYGIHNCVNVVCDREGVGSAVLIRAILPLDGISVMLKRRKSKDVINIANGPGKVAEALGIDLRFDGINLRTTGEIILQPAFEVNNKYVARTPRIGITKDKDKRWRFVVREEFLDKIKAKIDSEFDICW